jgi:hypothetical protein
MLTVMAMDMEMLQPHNKPVLNQHDMYLIVQTVQMMTINSSQDKYGTLMLMMMDMGMKMVHL